MMYYSTTKRRDLRRLVVGVIACVLLLCMLWALVPFGIDGEPTVSNTSDLKEADLAVLVDEAVPECVIPTRSEVYRATLLCPWERMQYSSSISVGGGPETYTVTAIVTSPSGRIWYSCTAVQDASDWTITKRKNAIGHY